MAGKGMYGTVPPSSVNGLMPSYSEEISTFFNHNSSSSASCIISKPKILPPHCHWLSPPPRTAGFSRSDDPNRFVPLKIGKPVASSDDGAVADSSSSFDFSDPYAYVPPHVTENDLFTVGVEDPDAKTSFKERRRISPQNNPGGIICPVETGEASELPSKPVPTRTSSKRSRAAEVHNLSEKRRRSRINEKMKALQNLIPNSNKTDKASMLDEAIEYLKQLQLQVQMLMMMRNGLSSHPMCLSGGLQPMILPQGGLNFDEVNGFQNSTSGIASSANAESLVQPAFSFSRHCSFTNHSVVIPSITNITTSDTSSSFQPYVKDALCGSMPQLLLDTIKNRRTPSPDVS